MCYCTPSIRTPFCGRMGCHPPTPQRLQAAIDALERLAARELTVTIVYRHAPPYTLAGVLSITSDGWMLRFACAAVTHYIVLGSVAELVFEE